MSLHKFFIFIQKHFGINELCLTSRIELIFDSIESYAYHCAPMNGQQIPQRLDPFKQIGAGVELEGRVELARLSRLDGLLVSNDGSVKLKLHFYRDEQKIAVLKGELSTQVNLLCQRCLSADALDIESSFCFALLKKEKDIGQLPESYEALILDEPVLDIYTLIEDELILALPIVHFHEKQCIDQRILSAEASVSQESELTKQVNPFTVLEKLKLGSKDES